MINSPTVRLIIIGAGKMGLAHSQAFIKTDGVDIVAITSRTLESAKRLADKFGVQIFGTEWKLEAIRSKATAAIIAVPHLLTEQLTSEVLEYGLHILVEKPVSLNSTTIKALGSMARKKGVIAMVAMNRRFYSTVIDGILITKFYGDVLGLTV
ncbi:MAG: Gfo/Idh/MocA family oxidoreductase, partial [Cyclobacteriaceae bacterium]